jgi:pimeloyl-ACP methyl ester carboxylesterase
VNTRIVAVATALLLLTGCTAAPAAGPESTPAPTFEALAQPTEAPRTPAEACLDPALGGTGEWIGADGAWFETGIVGEGTTVAVFTHQSNDGYCGFGKFAGVLAGLGIRSVLINLCGFGNTVCGLEDGVVTSGADAVLAAAQWARDNGATRVVSVGASLGGAVAILAAELDGDNGLLDGVVDLSGPLVYGGTDTQPLIADLTIPILFVVSGDDAVVSPSEMDELGEASSSENWSRIAGSGHGWAQLFAQGKIIPPGQAVIDFIVG